MNTYNRVSNLEETYFTDFFSFLAISVEAVVPITFEGNRMPGMSIFMAAICGITTVVFLVMYLVKRISDSHDEKMDNSVIKDFVLEISKEIEDIDRKMEEEQKAFNALKSEENVAAEEYSVKKSAHMEKAKAIRSALVEQYSSQVNPSDWKNLDLLIYYIKTGRADTVKEALQLVDRQRQTDQIVNAINEASVSISHTINDGIGRLGMAMTECFGILSKQMQRNFDSLNQSIRDASMINAAYMRDMIISNESLKKSLIANANKSSEVLVSQMDQLLYATGNVPHHA